MSSIAFQVPTARRSTVRLTRRGRLVVFVAALLALFALGLMAAGISGASDDEGEQVPTRTVVVGTGETLWDIADSAAEATAADDSIREMQERIEKLNALESPMLLAGQRLHVPIG